MVYGVITDGVSFFLEVGCGITFFEEEAFQYNETDALLLLSGDYSSDGLVFEFKPNRVYDIDSIESI